MANLDAATLAQQAVNLGLITSAQLQECREELGAHSADPMALLGALERKEYLTPWQSDKLRRGDEVGYFFGGYRLRFKVGAGSFGRIYRSDNPRTGEIVAVKVLRRRWTEIPHNVELFMREGRLGMTLRHPNIVSILAVNQDIPTGQYYIVMEFVEGANLRDFLRNNRKKLSPAEALRLLDDAVAGFAYAYSHGVTHRDMKLTNILISAQGVAKLVDFGLAGFHAPQGMGLEDEADEVERTVDYAGLEKATGVKPGDVRSDIYFLGCVLYEMLTGRTPLDMRRDKYSRMARHRFENVPPIGPEEVSAPPAVFRLVETMMSLDPKLRYQTPAQLQSAVRAARREVEGKSQPGNARPSERSVYIVETNPRLQEAMRERFKERGYRVFLSADPRAALNRFREQPFDALIVDVGTVGEDGLYTFDRIVHEADRLNLSFAGIVLLAKDQADWTEKVKPHPKVTVLVRPVTLKALDRKLRQLAPPR